MKLNINLFLLKSDKLLQNFQCKHYCQAERRSMAVGRGILFSCVLSGVLFLSIVARMTQLYNCIDDNNII